MGNDIVYSIDIKSLAGYDMCDYIVYSIEIESLTGYNCIVMFYVLLRLNPFGILFPRQGNKYQ